MCVWPCWRCVRKFVEIRGRECRLGTSRDILTVSGAVIPQPRRPDGTSRDGTERGFIADISRSTRGVVRYRRPPGAMSALPCPEQAKAALCQASTVAGRTTWSAARQPCQRCDSQAHSTRSTAVNRSRGRRERFTTASWCRSATTSRCSGMRESTTNRSEWSSETTTDHMPAGYATSIDARRTVFFDSHR